MKDITIPLTAKEIDETDTNELAKVLIHSVNVCDKLYFDEMEVPHEMISNINRMTAELTSRYLLSGF